MLSQDLIRIPRVKTHPHEQNKRRRIERLEPRFVLDSTVVFNEVMYHPADQQAPYEWVELHNQMAIDMDISEWRIDQGVAYQFPAGTIIPGGGYIVVASEPNALMRDTGITNVQGPFIGRLANSGESIQLVNNSDRIMDTLDYSDRGEWPVGPDGSGVTLSKRHRLSTSRIAENWTSSQEIGGTPGIANFITGEAPRSFLTFVDSQSQSGLFIPDTKFNADWTSPSYVQGSQGEKWETVSTSIGFEVSNDEVDYATTVLADSPLAYWRLNEAAGMMTAVTSGILRDAPNGAFSSDVTLAQPSLLEQPNDRSIKLTNDTAVAGMTTPEFEKYSAVDGIGGTGFTAEFWLQLESLPSSSASLIGDGASAFDFSFMVYIMPDGKLKTFVRTTNNAGFGITSTESERKIKVGETVHVVSSWDQLSGEMHLYVDGLEVTTNVIDGAIPTTGTARNTDNSIFIGRDQRNGGTFSALVDEVAIYNFALSKERVAAHAGAGGGPSLSNLIATNIEDSMHNVNASALVRVPFRNDSNIAIDQLSMDVFYDDGFVAYLNGTEVARRNAPDGILNMNATATTQRDQADVFGPEHIDLTSFEGMLHKGENLLAIHGLNFATDDASFFLKINLQGSGFPRALGDVPSLSFSEIAAANSDEFQVEITNTGNSPVPLEGLELVRDGTTREKYTFPATTIPSGGFFAISASQLGFDASSGDRLFLFMPGQIQLVDATHVTNRLRARAEEFPGPWNYPDVSTFGFANQFSFQTDIVINEIMYHPRLESDSDWIELFNRGDSVVDLSGWTIEDGIRFAFPAGASIKPHSYLVIAKDSSLLKQKYPEIANLILGDFSGNLSNQHDTIRLRDRNGNPADEVHYYDAGRWDVYADGGGSSLELIDPLSDNSVAEAWKASDESTTSEWQTITYRGTGQSPRRSNFPRTFHEFSFGLLTAGEILIDDLSVIEAPDVEALQFIQNGTFANGFDTWRPVGNHHGQIVPDPLDPSNDVFHLTARGPEEHLQNHVETTLKNGNTFERISTTQEYEISYRAKWLAGSSQLNTRLFFNILPQTTILSVPENNGTPGKQNSRFESNAGPTFHGFIHAPLSPTAQESVAVSIQADDPNGVSQLTLLYSVDESAFQSVSMSRTESGVYVGIIPPQRRRSTVQFYVSGSDSQEAMSLFPRGGTDSGAYYKVEDAPASTTGLHNLQIIVADSTERRLGSRTNLMSNDYLDATVIYEDQVHYDVGVRLKGSEHGRPDSNRRGLMLKFHPDHLFRGVHETVAVDRSGGWRFGRTFGQDEILIHQFFNRAGDIPSMFNDLVYVDAPTVNKGTAILQLSRFGDIYLDSQYKNGTEGTAYEYELIYAMQESRGRESLKAAQEGPSVVGINVGTDLGDDKEHYRHYFLIEGNRNRDDYDPMIRLARAFSQSTSKFNEAAREVVDVDQWMRAFAAMSLSGANDNYNAGSQHNAIFYQRPRDDKMLLFPFDLDFAFHLSANAPLSSNRDLTRFLRDDNNQHAFLGHLHDIMTVSFNEEYMSYWVSHVNNLLPTQNVSGILGWIRQRVSSVSSRFPAQVEFDITTENVTVDTPVVSIEGKGWINVRELRVHGSIAPLQIRWNTPTEWQANIAVASGTHELEIEAFDFRGNLIGADTVTITSTAENPIAESLRITEIHYNPSDPTEAELAASVFGLDKDAFEFLEFKNIGDIPINLLETKITAGVQFSFENTVLQPGQYGVVVQNMEAFQIRYGSDIHVLGQFLTGRLANSGDRISAIDFLGKPLFDFEYGDRDPWSERADGVGGSLVPIDESTPLSQYGNHQRWRGSTHMAGSPGAEDPEPIGVVVNEILANTDLADARSDSIELLNVTENAIDISGWFLSDSKNELFKFVIPNETVLSARDRIVFDEQHFNPNPNSPDEHHFALSGANGDSVWLTKIDADSGKTIFVDDVQFRATRPGESLGRIPDGEGRLVPLQQISLGTSNAQPRVGPVVVSEIGRSPTAPSADALNHVPHLRSDYLQFIEVYNSGDDVALDDWRIQGSVEFNFDDQVIIPQDETLVVVPFDPNRATDILAAFRAHYRLDASVNIIGPFDNHLDQFGHIQLLRAEKISADDPNLISRLLEDEVSYDTLSPWTVSEVGRSLNRVTGTGFGNDPHAWQSNAPSPGFYDVQTIDFNHDGITDAKDIDLLCRAVHEGMDDPQFDLNGDGSINRDDHSVLIDDVLTAHPGDANLDGVFHSRDLVLVFVSGKYEDGTPSNSGWADGDWNCDTEFSSSDLVLAFQRGQYQEFARAARAIAATDVDHFMRDFLHNASADSDSDMSHKIAEILVNFTSDSKKGRPRQNEFDLQFEFDRFAVERFDHDERFRAQSMHDVDKTMDKRFFARATNEIMRNP